jgi:hypothetical protein
MSDQAKDGKRDIRVAPARLWNHLGSAKRNPATSIVAGFLVLFLVFLVLFFSV